MAGGTTAAGADCGLVQAKMEDVLRSPVFLAGQAASMLGDVLALLVR